MAAYSTDSRDADAPMPNDEMPTSNPDDGVMPDYSAVRIQPIAN